MVSRPRRGVFWATGYWGAVGLGAHHRTEAGGGYRTGETRGGYRSMRSVILFDRAVAARPRSRSTRMIPTVTKAAAAASSWAWA